METLARLLEFLPQFFPPFFSWSYVAAILKEPALQSLSMALAGTLLAVTVGLSCALYIATGFPGGRALYAAMAIIRSIPDLTLAIFCVIAVGIGPGAGMLALAIFYRSAIGKVYADLFRTAEAQPLDALRSTGASRWAVVLFGHLPLRMKDLLSYGAYEFESAFRASVIVGAVGGGGIGTEIVGSINAIDFHRTTTLIILMVMLVALIDQGARWIKREPRWLLALLPLAIASLWWSWPSKLYFEHALSTYAAMFPPTLPMEDWTKVPRLLGETLLIAIGGTAFAVTAAIPLGLCAARNLAPVWLSFPARRLLETLRAIHEVVWGLVLVVIIGVGPQAGVAALALHSAGALGRLYAESFENIPLAPVHSLRATGAPPVATALFGFVPLALAPMAVHSLFRLEWNTRAATVVGVIGAGGMGEALFQAQQLQFYPRMMAYLLLICGLVLLLDVAGQRIRQRWGLTAG